MRVDDPTSWNFEAEQGLLGSILLDNEVLRDIHASLTDEDFYFGTHQSIYRAIVKLSGQGEAIDVNAVAGELVRSGELSGFGGDSPLLQIQSCVPHAAHAKYYADIVRQKSIDRQTRRSGGALNALAFF